MPEQAHLTSLEAVDDFRRHLIVYLSRARLVIEEVEGDLHRFRQWLELEQVPAAQRELNRRQRLLEDAKQALFSARLSTFTDATSTPEWAVHRARAAVEEAEDRVRRLRHWVREIDHRTEAIRLQLHAAENFLATDMTKAVAALTAMTTALAEYAELRSPPAGLPPTAGAEATAGSSPDTGKETGPA